MRRNIAIVRRHEVAGEHFHCCEEQQEHRRETKRLGPTSHLLHDATSHRMTVEALRQEGLRHPEGTMEHSLSTVWTYMFSNPLTTVHPSTDWYVILEFRYAG